MDMTYLKNDLSDEITEKYMNCKYLSIDTETTGLNLHRDKLCLVQLCDESGLLVLVKITSKDTPNLKKVLENHSSMKLFHFARFDLAILKRYLGITVQNVYCTKIVSKLVRTYTEKHGLKNLVSELAGIELDKSSQSTDWALDELSPKQLEYAAHDVLHLVGIKEKLDKMLEREGRTELAKKCLEFLPTLIELDLSGWDETLFSH